MNNSTPYATKVGVYVMMLLSFFYCSCANTDAEENQTYIALNESLLASINSTKEVNNYYMHSLVSKTHDFDTQEKAAIWYPKAKKTKNAGDTLCARLNNLAETIKAETGIGSKKGKENYGNISSEVLEKINRNGSLKKLDKYFNEFIDSMVSVDKEINIVIEGLTLTTKQFDSVSNKDFYKYFFENKNAQGAIATLTSFESNARIIEQQVLRFCDLKCRVFIENYTQFQVIVTQSSSYVKAGERIEVSAGVGNFSEAAQPKITIGGKLIELNYDGVATTKVGGSKIAGKHHIPVSIEFKKPDGSTNFVTKQIEYTVAE